MQSHLPLFPIDLVIYPGSRRVLHIFEPRYQALLSDALADQGCFVLLPPAADGDELALGTIGCVVRVVSHQPLEDGRSNIMIEGAYRCVLAELHQVGTPYLVGTIDALDDEADATPLPADLTATLRSLGERCLAALRLLTEIPEQVEWSEDTDKLTFQIAAAIPWDSASGWSLLALRSPTQRARRLLEVLPRVVPDLERKSRVHRRAHTNGHGSQSG